MSSISNGWKRLTKEVFRLSEVQVVQYRSQFFTAENKILKPRYIQIVKLRISHEITFQDLLDMPWFRSTS